MPCGPGQPVEFRHDQRVAFPAIVERRLQLCSGTSRRCLFGEGFSAARRSEVAMLCFESGLLVAGRCPCVPNQGSVLLLPHTSPRVSVDIYMCESKSPKSQRGPFWTPLRIGADCPSSEILRQEAA